MRTPLLTVCLAALLLSLVGCANQPIDWQRAHDVAQEADQMAAAWQPILSADDAAILDQVRQAAKPVLLALERRATDPSAPDPTNDLQTWLVFAGDVADAWPDEQQRQVAMAAISTIRLSLTLTGINVAPKRIEEDDVLPGGDS